MTSTFTAAIPKQVISGAVSYTHLEETGSWNPHRVRAGKRNQGVSGAWQEEDGSVLSTLCGDKERV